MDTVHLITHPLILDSLTHLRNNKASLQQFRQYSNIITQLLFIESIHDLTITKIAVETPLMQTTGMTLSDDVVVVPVLRAGIAMLFGALELVPNSKIGFVGLERDEKTAIASKYYLKLPTVTTKSVVIITDPMLATGGSLLHILRHISPIKPQSIRVVCVIAAPEGIRAVQKEFPHVHIYTGAIDKGLNDKKYIVPGLGDYGDRYFGT